MGVRMGRAGWEVTSLKEKKYLKELQERKKERMEERMEESEQDEPRGRRLTKIGVKTSINKLMNKGKLSIK